MRDEMKAAQINALTSIADRDIRAPSLLERLHDEKHRLESRLRDINEALSALEADPKVMATLEMLSKVTHL